MFAEKYLVVFIHKTTNDNYRFNVEESVNPFRKPTKVHPLLAGKPILKDGMALLQHLYPTYKVYEPTGFADAVARLDELIHAEGSVRVTIHKEGEDHE